MRRLWHAGPTTCSARLDHLAHDAVVLALGALVAEARPLEHRARAVVEEGRGRLLRADVERVGLDEAAARRRDERQGALERGVGDALTPVPAVDEEAGQPVVRHGRALHLDLRTVRDAGQLRGAAVLAPADRGVTVE